MESRHDDWVILEVELPPELEEEAGGVFTGLGSAAQELALLGDGRLRLAGFFAPAAPPAALAAVAEGLLESVFPGRSLHVTSRVLGATDWVARSREAFRPTAAGRHFLIHPSWDVPADTGGRIPLQIDPQQAFGTGSHETTRLCIALIENHFADHFHRVLDAGCGSGILLIALAHWRRRTAPGTETEPRFLGIDIDEASVETARENAERNGCGAGVELRCQDLAGLKESPFHFILANLLSETLCRNASTLDGLLLPGGRLVMSGILASEADDVKRHFPISRWNHLETAAEGEWVAIALEKIWM